MLVIFLRWKKRQQSDDSYIYIYILYSSHLDSFGKSCGSRVFSWSFWGQNVLFKSWEIRKPIEWLSTNLKYCEIYWNLPLFQGSSYETNPNICTFFFEKIKKIPSKLPPQHVHQVWSPQKWSILKWDPPGFFWGMGVFYITWRASFFQVKIETCFGSSQNARSHRTTT